MRDEFVLLFIKYLSNIRVKHQGPIGVRVEYCNINKTEHEYHLRLDTYGADHSFLGEDNYNGVSFVDGGEKGDVNEMMTSDVHLEEEHFICFCIYLRMIPI